MRRLSPTLKLVRLTLIGDHHIQRGPFFSQPLDMLVDAITGTVTIRSTDKDGSTKETSEHMNLPGDLCNGIVGTMLLKLPSNSTSENFDMVAPTGKGRLVKIAVTPLSDVMFGILRDALKRLRSTVYTLSLAE